MKKHGPYLLLAMALVLAPLGCEEDATGPEGLNEAEVEALFNGINETVGALLQDTTLTPVFLSLDSVVFEPECPQGGRVRVAVFPPEVDTLVTLAIDISTNLVPTGCVVSGDGYTFTLTGNPSLRYQLKVAFVSLVQVRMQGASEGTLDWELEDRDGTCDFDLVLDATVDSSSGVPSVEGGYTGTMCGLEVEFDAPVGLLLSQPPL